MLETDFEDESIGNSADFPADTGDGRNGTTMLADVASYSSSQQLHVKDADNTLAIKRLRTLRFSYSIYSRFFFDLKVIQSTYGYANGSYIQIDFYEASTIRISLRIDCNTGLIYNETSSAYSTTGVSLTVGTTIHLGIELTSASTWKLSIDNGNTWSAAINNQATITSYINKMGIQTATVNGILASGNPDEDFQAYSDGSDLVGQGSWTAVTTCVHGTCKDNGSSDKVGQQGMSAGSNHGGTAWTWPTSGYHTDSTWNTITGRFRATHAAPMMGGLGFYESTETHATFNMGLDGGSPTNLQFMGTTLVTMVANTWYYFKIHFRNSDYKCYCEVGTDGSTYPYTVGSSGSPISYTNNYYPHVMEITCNKFYNNYVQVDDINVDWNDVAAVQDTVEAYIDNVYGYYYGCGSIQVQDLVYKSNHLGILCQDAVECGGYVFVYDLSNGCVWKLTPSSMTWTNVLSFGGTTTDYYLEVVGTRVYVVNAVLQMNVAGTIKYTADNGSNWSNVSTTGLGSNIYASDIFNLNGNLIAVALNYTSNIHLEVWQYTPDTGWAEKGSTYDLGALTSPCANLIGVSGTTLAFIHAHDKIFKYDSTGPTVSLISTQTGYVPTPEGSGAQKVMHGVVDGTTMITTFYKVADSKYYQAYSTDTGATWTVGVQMNLQFQRNTDYTTRQYAWNYRETDGNTCMFYYTNGHMQQWRTPKAPNMNWIDCASASGYVIVRTSSVSEYCYHVEPVPTTDMLECTLFNNICVGTGYASRVEFITYNDVNTYYNVGDNIELYDQFAQFAFKGIIMTKSVGPGITNYIAYGAEQELGRYYNADFTTVKVSSMLSSAIGTFTRSKVGSLTTGSATTFTYTQSKNRLLTPLFRMARGWDRIVIYAKPSIPYSQWYSTAYNACTATGYRVKNNIENWDVIDNQADTRASNVTRTSMLNGTTRTTYIGSANNESLYGVVQAQEFQDDQFPSGNATAFATSLYNILSQPTTFLHLLANNVGCLQTGYTIDFSWSLGSTTVARVTFIIIATKHDLICDLQEVVVSNNIVLEYEYENMDLVKET